MHKSKLSTNLFDLLRNVINKFETKHRNWLQLCLPLASGDLPKAVKGRHIIIIVAGAAE